MKKGRWLFVFFMTFWMGVISGSRWPVFKKPAPHLVPIINLYHDPVRNMTEICKQSGKKMGYYFITRNASSIESSLFPKEHGDYSDRYYFVCE